MKHVELKQALDLLTKVLANPSIEPERGEQLRRAKRELETVLRTGKLDRPRVFRIIELIANVLLETLRADADPR